MSISGQPQQGSGASGTQHSTQEHLHNLADTAGATLDDASRQVSEQFEKLREQATDQLDSLVEGAQSAAQALEGKDSLGVSQYLGQLAQGLSAFADRVRDKSAEDLLHEGARLARDNPALFVAGSVAIGFGLSRFLRASANHVDYSVEDSPSAAPLSTPSASAPAFEPGRSSTFEPSGTTSAVGTSDTTAADALLRNDTRGFD